MNDSSHRARRWKRCIVFIVTALLAVVTTVAVSWACALWIDPLANMDDNLRLGGSDQDPAADPTFNRWGVREIAVLGGTVIFSAWLDEDVRYEQANSWPTELPEEILPAWALKSMRPEVTGTTGQSHVRLGDAWGWPFNAMWTKWRSVDTTRFMPVFECDHCIRLSNGSIGSGLAWEHDRALPLRIIWQGFALNTMLYWVAWLFLYLLFAFAIGGSRRFLRRRRGRCAKCGYDLQGCHSEHCPECGHEK